MNRYDRSLRGEREREFASAIVRNDGVFRDEDQKGPARLDFVRDLFLPRTTRFDPFVVVNANAARGKRGDLRFDPLFFAVRVADEHERFRSTVGRMPGG